MGENYAQRMLLRDTSQRRGGDAKAVRLAAQEVLICNGYRRVYDELHCVLGCRPIHASLSKQSMNVSEKVVRRLKKLECLIAVGCKRRWYRWYVGEISPAPDDLLNRDFSANAPNAMWFQATSMTAPEYPGN